MNKITWIQEKQQGRNYLKATTEIPSCHPKLVKLVPWHSSMQKSTPCH